MSLCNLVSFRNIRNATDGRWFFTLKNVESSNSIKNETGCSEKCFARIFNSEFWDTFASTTKPSWFGMFLEPVGRFSCEGFALIWFQLV